MGDVQATWLLALVVIPAGVAALVSIQRRHTARVRAERARLFEACHDIVDDPTLVERGLDFPVLQGRWRGRPVRLEPVVDTLTLRTLPVLWVVVTVGGPNDVPGTLSVLARECGTEFYARHQELGDPVAVDDRWPRELSPRSAGWGDEGPSRPCMDAICEVMADGKVKQLVVAPEALRVVWRAAVAQSSAYRVTRRVDLDGARVDPLALRGVLDAAGEVVRLAEQSAAEPTEAHR